LDPDFFDVFSVFLAVWVIVRKAKVIDMKETNRAMLLLVVVFSGLSTCFLWGVPFCDLEISPPHSIHYADPGTQSQLEKN